MPTWMYLLFGLAALALAIYWTITTPQKPHATVTRARIPVMPRYVAALLVAAILLASFVEDTTKLPYSGTLFFILAASLLVTKVCEKLRYLRWCYRNGVAPVVRSFP